MFGIGVERMILIAAGILVVVAAVVLFFKIDRKKGERSILASVLSKLADFTSLNFDILEWETIVAWFKDHEALKLSGKDTIAFTFHKTLEDGTHEVIQGICNKETDEILDAVVYKSKELDGKLSEAHRDDELVIYE